MSVVKGRWWSVLPLTPSPLPFLFSPLARSRFVCVRGIAAAQSVVHLPLG
jgi:hypothetical protein